MILRRLGNKKKLAKKLQAYFPPHKIYIEPFFGAGGMFFNKPKAKYNIVNDLDSDVFNLFQVVMNQKEELERAFYLMPIHRDLLNYWRQNKEKEPIKKALRFLLMSNFTFLGTGRMLVFGASVSRATSYKIDFNKKLNNTFDYLFAVQFNNKDFKDFLKNISLDDRSGKGETNQTFIYSDPPYLYTDCRYTNIFKESDSSDLFDSLQKTGCKFAYSEFDHPFIIQQAKERNLNVHIIGERQNLKNRRIEILVTNYKLNQLTLF